MIAGEEVPDEGQIIKQNGLRSPMCRRIRLSGRSGHPFLCILKRRRGGLAGGV